MWVDSWRSMWGGDENSAQEASSALDPLRELIRRHNVAAGLLHHANKIGQYRGSTAVGASVESIVEFSKAEDDDDRRRRRLRNSACRFEEEADDRWVRLEADRTRGLLLIDECEPCSPPRGGRPPAERDGTAASCRGAQRPPDDVAGLGAGHRFRPEARHRTPRPRRAG